MLVSRINNSSQQLSCSIPLQSSEARYCFTHKGCRKRRDNVLRKRVCLGCTLLLISPAWTLYDTRLFTRREWSIYAALGLSNNICRPELSLLSQPTWWIWYKPLMNSIEFFFVLGAWDRRDVHTSWSKTFFLQVLLTAMVKKHGIRTETCMHICILFQGRGR